MKPPPWFALTLALAGPAGADAAGEAPAPDPARRMEISGFVDLVAARNFNEPAEHANFLPGLGTSAKRDNELSINLAQIDFVLPPEPVGFHLAAGTGTALEVVHAAEVRGVATHPDVWRNVVRASLQYRTKGGLLVEAGVYPSHIGSEAFQTKDNWNYTRSWLGELSPYYQTGVKLARPLGGRWSAEVHLLNGWQVIADNNRAKSLGWRFAREAEKVSLSFNGIVGPELPENDHDLRALVDTVALWKATPSWSFGVSVDAAREEQPQGDVARWWGGGLYARLAPPGTRAAVALRAEYYDDGDGAISGTPQILREVTLTLEHRPAEQLILKFEGRYDRSSAEVFAGDLLDLSGAAVRDRREQTLFLIGAVAVF
ncbi:MAG: outer membrane beta-barrel protein [Candidatus Polarisedimenticolia bacterium]